MPDFGRSLNLPTTENQSKDSFFSDDVKGIADLDAYIDRVDKDIEEDAKIIEMLDKDLEEQKKFWKQREEWDPFYAEKMTKRKQHLDKQELIKNTQLFICFACGRGFDDEEKMRDHVNSTHLTDQGYLFKCSKCFRRFKLKHHLTRHEKTHDELAVFRCTSCSASFRKVESMKIHQSRAHNIDESGQLITALKYKCNGCEQHFGTLLELNRHKYICLKRRQRSSEEKKESQVTNDEAGTSKMGSSDFSRPLLSKVCHVCNNKFASTQSLIRHIGRKHPSEQYRRQYEVVSIASTPDLPFVCSECQKRFSNTSALSLHKRRHAGDRPYECNRCGRRYPLASELRKHVRRTHDSNKETKNMTASGKLHATDGREIGTVSTDQYNHEVAEKVSTEDDLTNFVL